MTRTANTRRKGLVEILPGQWIDTRQPLRIQVLCSGPIECDVWPRPDFPTPWWLVWITVWVGNYGDVPIKVAYKTEKEAQAAAKKFAAKINRIAA